MRKAIALALALLFSAACDDACGNPRVFVLGDPEHDIKCGAHRPEADGARMYRLP